MTRDAETAPLATPEYYQYTIDTAEVAEVWRRGSVVGSWLLDLTATALLEDPDLAGFSGRVSDSGEGRWTALAAVEEGVPAYVLTAVALRAVQLARRGRLRQQAPVGDAKAVRRARREDDGLEIANHPSPAITHDGRPALDDMNASSSVRCTCSGGI